MWSIILPRWLVSIYSLFTLLSTDRWSWRQSIADATAHVVARADAPKAATGARGLLAAAAAAGGRFAASNA